MLGSEAVETLTPYVFRQPARCQRWTQLDDEIEQLTRQAAALGEDRDTTCRIGCVSVFCLI